MRPPVDAQRKSGIGPRECQRLVTGKWVDDSRGFSGQGYRQRGQEVRGPSQQRAWSPGLQQSLGFCFGWTKDRVSVTVQGMAIRPNHATGGRCQIGHRDDHRPAGSERGNDDGLAHRGRGHPASVSALTSRLSGNHQKADPKDSYSVTPASPVWPLVGRSEAVRNRLTPSTLMIRWWLLYVTIDRN